MKALKLHYFVAALLTLVGLNTASADYQTDQASRLAQSIAQDSRSIVQALNFRRGGRDGYGSDRGGWDTGRGRGGFGNHPAAAALQDVRSMAQAARSLSQSTRSYYATVESTKYEFNSLQRAHQQAERSKYQIRRQHLVSHFYSSIQRSMGQLASLYMRRGGARLTKIANRLDMVTSRLKQDIRMDIGGRGYRTPAERQLMQAARQLEADADQFKMIVDRRNGQGRGPRVRQQLQTVRQSLRAVKRASRQAVLSYTAQEKLQKVRNLVQRAADVLGQPGSGRGGNGGRHGNGNGNFGFIN